MKHITFPLHPRNSSIGCYLLLILSYFIGTTIASTAANAYVNVPIYLDHNITVNYNPKFHTERNDSSIDSGSVSLSQFFPQQNVATPSVSQNQKTHPPYVVADLSKRLEEQFKWMRDHELEIPTIQKLFDATGRALARNDSRLVAQFALKLQKKLESAVLVVNKTTVQINQLMDTIVKKSELRKMNIELPSSKHGSATMTEESDRKLVLESMVFPCNSYDDEGNDVATDGGDGGGGTEEHTVAVQVRRKPADILNFLSEAGHNLQEHEDLNFTLNSQLLETMKAIDLNVPNFKNAYFLSRDNYGGDSNCRDHYSNQKFR